MFFILKRKKLLFAMLFNSILLFVALFLLMVSSARVQAATWVTINSSDIIINATYPEEVEVVSATLKDEQSLFYGMDKTVLNSGKTIIYEPRSKLKTGEYTFFIKVADNVGNTRNDTKTFEIEVPIPAGCGNGVKSSSEECDDGNNQDGDGCSAYCKLEVCGNNVIDAGEECDGYELNGQTCNSLGVFEGGALACRDDCFFDTSDCQSNASGYCGDHELNDAELCDYHDFGEINDCKDFEAFTGGALGCRDDCHFDTTYCEAAGDDNKSCYDDEFNGDETDTDCGGSCPCCALGNTCLEDSDCCAYFCKNNVCAQASCTDNTLNGLETDVDCGGDCPSCSQGQKCNIDSDCTTGFCNPDTGTCAIPSCSDGFKNGDETGVDCGGSCASGCSVNEQCNSDQDCVQGLMCVAGKCVTDQEQDSDGDGMPDWWENAHGLDPNDPYDADEDLDGDGYSNLDEYLDSTDPEDPKDPEPAKKHTFQTVFLILGLLLMIGSAGLLVYYRKAGLAGPARTGKGPLPGQARTHPPGPGQKPGTMRLGITGPGTGRGQKPKRFVYAKTRPGEPSGGKSQRRALFDRFGKGEKQAGTGKVKAPVEPAPSRTAKGFIPLSSVGKKLGKEKAGEKAREKTREKDKEEGKQAALQKTSSPAFEKLKDLIKSDKDKNKKQESKK